MKHWIFAFIGSFTLLRNAAEAAPKCRALNVYSDHMELSKLQRTMTIEINELYKEKYQFTRNFHTTRLDMLEDFVQGKISRAALQKRNNESHDARMTQDHELKISTFELLTSFSEKQKEQLRKNLNAQELCLQENIPKIKRDRPKIGEILFQELDLSKAQKNIILEMYHDRRDSFPFTPRYALHHEDLILGYLDGDIDEKSSELSFENKVLYETSFRQDEIDAMMDLLESFTPNQKDQLVRNIAEIRKL